MKKLCSLWIFILALLVSRSCAGNSYELSQPHENIQKIEIVDLSDTSYGYYPPSEEEICQMEAYGVVDKECWDEFLEKFQDMKCKSYWSDPTWSLHGKMIRIQYTDGLYELISAATIIQQQEDGWWHYTMDYFDSEEYQAFIDDVLKDMIE